VLEAPFRVGDVATLLGTNARRVEGWVEQGFLKPAHRGRGPGKPHRFTMEQLVAGALLLEAQANFGEKSPICGRLFPVAVNLIDLAKHEQEAGRRAAVILGVALKGGEVEHIGIVPQEGPSSLQSYVYKGLTEGHTVTFFNVSAIMAAVEERLER
jgi:hypothetical protein